MSGKVDKKDRRERLLAARKALAAGEPERAVGLFQDLASETPDNVQFRIGLGRASLAAGRPAEALDHVSVAIGMAADPDPQWLVLQSRILADLYEFSKAKRQLEELITQNPDFGLARICLVSILRRQGRHAEALGVLDGASLAAYPSRERVLATRVNLLFNVQRRSEAHQLFVEAVEQATTVAGLTAMFQSAPGVFGEGDSLRTARLQIRNRLARLEPPVAANPQAQLLEVRLSFALGEYSRFRQFGQALLRAGRGFQFTDDIAAAIEALATPIEGRLQKAKVFGIGLSKTATTSLHAALTELGYSAQHWANPISNEILRPRDANLFDALSDIPAADFYPVLAERFPNARFVLTERPLESWHASIIKHNKRRFGIEDLAGLRDMLDELAQDGDHRRWCGMGKRIYTQYASYPEAYRAHIEAVERFFQAQPQRLLRFNVFEGDGWDKLCAFLDRPVPEGPFPFANPAIT